MAALLPTEDTRVYEFINEEYFTQHGHCAGHPVINLGSGDSMLFLDVLPTELLEEKDAFDTMNAEINWNVMNHKGSQVPRLISIQGQARESDGAHPLYRHPADQQPELVPFTPLADRSRDIIARLLGQPFNHALIQKYRSGRDNIGEHADKTLDILRGSAIVNLSLGATRTMILKSKGDYVSRLDEAGATVPTRRLYQKITLPHNSVFVLGWQSNRDFLHSIRADKRLPAEKTVGELAHNEQRISLTFRTIATFVDAAGRITGQGARDADTSKVTDPSADHKANHEADTVTETVTESQDEKEEKRGSACACACGGGDSTQEKQTSVSHNNINSGGDNTSTEEKEEEVEEDANSIVAQSHALLLAFSEENKTCKFDWERRYGPGFDIINFAFVNDGGAAQI